MNTSICSAAIGAMLIATFSTGANAAAQVSFEVGNKTGEEVVFDSPLPMSGASEGTRAYIAPSKLKILGVTLPDANYGSITLQASAGGKVCEFSVSHERKFQWWSIDHKPRRSATGKSIGHIAADCSASILQGGLKNYSVKLLVGNKPPTALDIAGNGIIVNNSDNEMIVETKKGGDVATVAPGESVGFAITMQIGRQIELAVRNSAGDEACYYSFSTEKDAGSAVPKGKVNVRNVGESPASCRAVVGKADGNNFYPEFIFGDSE